MAIIGWVGQWYANPGWRWVRTPVDIPLLLFVSWSIVALVTALDVPYSAREIKNELLANGVMFVLAVSASRRERAVDVLAWSITLAGLVVGTYAVVESEWSLDLILSRGGRTSSFTSDPIFLSSYLVLAIPVALYLALATRQTAARWAAWAIWLVLMAALVSTVTRAAWLAVALQFLVYGVLRSRRALVAWIAVFAAIIGSLAFQPSLRETVVAGGWFNDYGRTAYWEGLVPRLADSPVSGFGYGQKTPDLAAPGVRSATPAIDSSHAFNSFVQTALELGLVGLGLFCWLLWRVAITLWRGARSVSVGSSDSVWLACMLMVLAGFILRNQFDHLFRDSPGHLFWILMGLGVGRAVLINERADTIR
ncbi:MAG: O-antigen ligase family protein [Nitrospirota bacterium]